MKYYILKNKEMPWGDYGDTLFKGFLNVMDDNYNDLEFPLLERTGPYVPELYIANSSDIVCHDKVRAILEDQVSGITEFRTIKIKKIVDINWTDWDVNEPAKIYPKSGEPEDYINKRKHEERLVSHMPALWNVKIVKKNRLKKLSERKGHDYNDYTHLALEGEVVEDIFTPENMLHTIVSEKFKNLIEKQQISSIRFIEIQRLDA